MLYKFFQIPLADYSDEETKLNDFLRSHKIVDVDKTLVSINQNAYWAICVGYIMNDSTNSGTNASSKKSRVDYREILDEETFKKYAILRDIRNTIATTDGIPPYAIFTNDELAQIAALKDFNKNEILQIKGIGDKKLEKYFDRFVSKINEHEVATINEPAQASSTKSSSLTSEEGTL